MPMVLRSISSVLIFCCRKGAGTGHGRPTDDGGRWRGERGEGDECPPPAGASDSPVGTIMPGTADEKGVWACPASAITQGSLGSEAHSESTTGNPPSPLLPPSPPPSMAPLTRLVRQAAAQQISPVRVLTRLLNIHHWISRFRPLHRPELSGAPLPPPLSNIAPALSPLSPWLPVRRPLSPARLTT